MTSPSFLDPLRERDFARLWVGQLISNSGDWVTYVALTAVVWELTGSAWMIAVLRACHAVPFLLVGPFAGVLVDRALGPALGGVLLAGAGTAAAFYLDSASFAISAIAIASMAVSGATPSTDGDKTSPHQDLQEGLAFVASRPEVRGVMLLEVGLMLGWGCINVLAIVIAERVLGGGPTEFGLLLASVGAGSLLGAVVIGGAGNRWPLGRLFPAGFVALFIAVAILAQSSLMLVACLGYFLAGLGRVGIDVSATTVYQKVVPDQLRGRVFALRYTVAHLAVIGANQAAGLFSDAVSIEPILMTASILLLGCAGVSILLLQDLQRALAR